MLVYGQDPLETSPVPKTVAATPCFDVEDDEEPKKNNFKKYVSGMCAAICVEVSFSTQTVRVNTMLVRGDATWTKPSSSPCWRSLKGEGFQGYETEGTLK